LSSLRVPNKRHASGIEAILDSIVQVEKRATVILIGSASRDHSTWRSDIDLMVITPQPLRLRNIPSPLHLHFLTRDEFLTKLRSGAEFESWAVRFGKLLIDAECWWAEVLKEDPHWPDWREKLKHIDKRLRIAKLALEDEDREAAEEELLMAASHYGRALLLISKDFPLSRPELPQQLSRIREFELGNALSTLIHGDVPFDRLKADFGMVNHGQRRLRREAARLRTKEPSVRRRLRPGSD
jgi:predicted nucleotidyltransferase